MTDVLDAAGESLRGRALRALGERRTATRVWAAEQQALHRQAALANLVKRLREMLGIDASGVVPEWVEGEYGEEPVLTIEGVRFTVRHLEAHSTLAAGMERVAERCGHLSWRHLNDSGAAWSQLGELVERMSNPGERCGDCRSYDQADWADIRPLPVPSLGERLAVLLRELVREEIGGDV